MTFWLPGTTPPLCMRKRDPDGALPGCPARTSAWLRRVPKVAPDLFAMYIGSTQHVLPDDFCAALPAPAAPAAPEEAPAEDAAPTDAPDTPDSPAEIPVPQETASQAAPVHGGILAWSTLDEHPHATTAHRQFHYVTPGTGLHPAGRSPAAGYPRRTAQVHRLRHRTFRLYAGGRCDDLRQYRIILSADTASECGSCQAKSADNTGCCKGERRQWRKQRTEAGAAVTECEGLLSPKHDAGTATRHYRAFWQRRCRATAAGAVLKP